MKLHLAGRGAHRQVTGHGAGWVEVDGARHATSLIVFPTRLIAPWPVARIEHLTAEHCDALIAERPEVVLLGTGARIAFPARALLAPFVRARIGLEVMDTAAACRTYNILAAEGREVAAALVVG